MLKQGLRQISIVVVAASMIATAAVAQDGGDDALSACAKESDDARRLACYDRVTRSQAAPAPKPEPKPTEQPAATATDEFGVTGSAVARQRSGEQKQQDQSAEVRSVSAGVTEVSWRPRGEFVVTLDNGQVWAQKDSGQRFPIKPGDRVTINAGLLGSYRLINGPRSTQVTRVK